MEENLKLSQLKSFYGTENYYNVMGTKVTDGVKYIMDNGYGWLVIDAIIICRMKLRNFDFIKIKLKVNKEKETAEAIYTDGDGKIIFKQKYEWTDAEAEPELYYVNNLLMLVNEY